jgi:RNA polymerase sigma factor (sigma-70 family)
MVDQTLTRTEWIETALRRYEQPLLRHAYRMTGDPELARDVVQDAFLQLCRAERERVEGHLAAWLYTVCRNRALDVLKKEGRMRRMHDPQAIADTRSSPGEAALRNEVHDLVLEVVGSLSADEQEAFRLKFQDQLTYREIAQVMGKSLGTVSKLLTSALRTVRDRLRTRLELVQEG